MPIIQTDTRGKYVPFIIDTYGDEDSYHPPVLTYPYYDPVELGLEKPLLKNPLKVESGLQLYFKGVPRYTGNGEETTTTAPITLDLLTVLKTVHAITLSPSILTLDEDNTYTTFCAVETNDGADWTIVPDVPELSYALGFSGTQFINTGVAASSSLRVVADVMPIESRAASPNNCPLWGIRNGTNYATTTNQFVCWWRYNLTDSTDAYIGSGDNNALQRPSPSDTPWGVRCVIDQNRHRTSRNGTLLATSPTATFTLPGTFLLGAIRNGDGTIYAYRFGGNVYRCRIYDHDILVRDFVPVPQGDTRFGSPAPSHCMWCRVTQQYYQNAGTGSFTIEPVEESRITVTPTSGTGRGAVIVKKAASFNLFDLFENIPLTAVSTANATTYPDIDGDRQVSDTAEVHVEQYSPEHNALIPTMDSNTSSGVTVTYMQESVTAEAWKAFDHSLTTSGIAGRFTTGMYPGVIDLDNLHNLPGIEVSFDTPHRIRSWSLQSVGSRNNDMVASALVLQGRGLDGTWRVLDLARMQYEYNDNTESSQPELYTESKNRLDRKVQHVALVDKIRIIAAEIQNSEQEGLVLFPQIQVFAGVPVLPKMQSANQAGVQIESNGGSEIDYADEYSGGASRDVGIRVFDRQVSGSGLASIGSRAWYINNNHFLLDDVAENGVIRQFGAYESKAWLSLMFPRARIVGYLYSIDNLQNRTDHHANVSYAASLYFEGRQNAEFAATKAPSSQWDFIDLISLDRCLGHNAFGDSTASLVAEAGQVRINAYVANLGLPVLDQTFLMNRTDYHFIRYDAGTQQWYDDGWRLRPGTAGEFNNMTTGELLAQSGQSLLNTVALDRGTALSLSWTFIPDKASIVNQKDNRRVIYDLATSTWSEVPNNDAIYHVHDRTHYADLKDSTGTPMLLEQLRCTVQSIMNTEKPSISGEPVVMPEMQLFGLPAETINAGAVASVTYLKVEDSSGNLHDILGSHQRLHYYSYYASTTFRFYVGEVENIKATDKKLYLAIQNNSGTFTTSSTPIEDSYSSNSYRSISIAGNYRTLPAYFEVYIYSADSEKIVLSSGYTGGVL